MPQVAPAARPGPLGLLLPPMPPRAAWSTDGTTNLPTFGSTAWVVRTAHGAEEAGAGGLWASDHLFWRRPALDCLTTLAAAATATRGVLGTCVLQLPMRSTAAVAKAASSVQLLSSGRFVLGVGVGSHAAEYELAGAPFAERGDNLERAILGLRDIWSGEVGLPGYRQEPALAAPVWVGGSSARARRRAARVGDGWIPLFVEPDRFAEGVARLADETAAAGRDPAAVTPAVVMVASVGASREAAAAEGLPWLSHLYGIPAKAFERHLVAGPPERCASRAVEYLEAGAAHVVVMVAGDDALGQFGALAEALGAPASVGAFAEARS